MQAPNEPTGNDPASSWLRKLVRYARASELKSSPGVRVNRGINGTTIEIDPSKGVAVSGVTFRGERVAGTSSAVNEIWVVRGGSYAGTYICVATNPPSGSTTPLEPPNGTVWVQLAGNALGAWG